MKQRLIAVPKGRLDLCKNFVMENRPDVKIVSVRNADILPGIKDNLFAGGVVGSDMFVEYKLKSFYNKDVDDLPFLRKTVIPVFPSFHFSLIKKKKVEIKELKIIKVATKYPNKLRQTLPKLGFSNFSDSRFYSTKKNTIEIIAVHGQTETYVSEGLADCAFEIVQTGNTLKEHKLIEFWSGEAEQVYLMEAY
jgi:ATP phosphoribosyltransferase